MVHSLIVGCLTPFSILFQLNCGVQYIYPRFPGYFLPGILLVFPNYLLSHITRVKTMDSGER